MARLQENVSLQPFNTFGLDLNARWFFKVQSPEAALEFLMDNQEAGRPVLILGGGSNVLFRSDFPGLVLYNQIKGYTVVKEDGDHVWLKVGAGENWHQLVLYTLSRNWGGLENLSLIPGSVGAAPIQNIGAYGVEQKEVFWELNAIHLTTGSFCRFIKEECQFGYRDSIFKRQAKGSYLIYSVTFRLNKKPVLNTSYGAIERELKDLGLEPTIHSVSQAVINIRSRKLPNPAQIGNSGSFFKNPVISPPQFKVLAESYPDAPHYPQ
ncbi:MAG: UDP-N-acetylmuramate dehydrogenase, partial [Bacteroidota bacterium]